MAAPRHRMLEGPPLWDLAPKTQAVRCCRRPPRGSRLPMRSRPAQYRGPPPVFPLPIERETCRRAHLPHPTLWDPVFLQRTLKRPWPICALVRPRKSHKRPVVLSPPDVRDRLGLVAHPTVQLCLRLIYACGLRLMTGRIFKSLISTPPAGWCECATARGAKTAWCHWPTGPSNACKRAGTWYHKRPYPW